MSRIRTVKPELFKHEDLFDAELNSGLPLRLAFIGLFTVADCEGRFKWRPRTLKLDVLPHDTVDFAKVLQALEQGGFIQSYEVDGERYGWIPSFTKHQIFQTKEQTRGSQLPPPPSTTRDDAGTVPGRFQNEAGTCRESQERKGKEKEGKGMDIVAHAPEHEDQPSALPVNAAPIEAASGPDDFETFWTTYPKRAGGNPKTTALKAWNARRKDGHTAATLIDGAQRYAAYCQATGKINTEYVKQASTFINQLSFLDPWSLPAQRAAPPHNGQRQQASSSMTPEMAEWDAILRGLKPASPVIEGECHATH